MAFFLSDFHDANDAFGCCLKVKKIRKFPNRLYFLQSYTIAIRGNVTTDFRIHSRNVIVRAKMAVSTSENMVSRRSLTKMTTA